MKLMRTLMRVILMPVSWLIRLLIAFAAFLVSLSSSLLGIVAILFILLAVVMFGIGEYGNAYALLILAALISPVGIPLIANYILDGLDYLLTRLTHAIF